MKRIMVIGSPGAGKSTFSRKLAEKTGLPLTHLDLIWHKSDRTTISREEFDDRLRALCAQEEWIIDGNYARTLEIRMAACDTVILLDYPAELCLAGALARLGVRRDDMPWIETTLDPEFQGFIESFAKTTLPRVYALMQEHRGHTAQYVCRSRADADALLARIDTL